MAEATQMPRLKVTSMQAAIMAAAAIRAARIAPPQRPLPLRGPCVDKRGSGAAASARASGSSRASVLANVVGESKVK